MEKIPKILKLEIQFPKLSKRELWPSECNQFKHETHRPEGLAKGPYWSPTLIFAWHLTSLYQPLETSSVKLLFCEKISILPSIHPWISSSTHLVNNFWVPLLCHYSRYCLLSLSNKPTLVILYRFSQWETLPWDLGDKRGGEGIIFWSRKCLGVGRWRRALGGQQSPEDHPLLCHKQLRFWLAASLHFWYF